jgi:hypothetical protein
MGGVNMDSGSRAKQHDQFQQLIGALDIIGQLRQEMEQWLEEAQDASKHETLENVVGHLRVMEDEYRRRSAELQEKPGSG